VTELLERVVALVLSAMVTISATAPAVRAETVQAVPPPPVVTTPEFEGPCAEWGPLALEVGWTREQWPTVARVMECESRCQPDAYNGSHGASGLMQVLARYFAAGADPFDPATNLAKALDVWHSQGWRAWSCY
jgi:hypothetical protein